MRGDQPRAADSPLTVLVAEGEPAILPLLVTILGWRGYEVVAASSGDEALLRADEGTGGPHAILVKPFAPDRLVESLREFVSEAEDWAKRHRFPGSTSQDANQRSTVGVISAPAAASK